jgi:uncharacterized RDD family membrane protein YckC
MQANAERPALDGSAARPAEIAGPGSRFCAVVVDTAISATVLAVAFIPIALLSGADSSWSAAELSTVPVFVVATASFLYQGLSETFVNGRTIGKRLMGLRAISADGTPLTKQQALARNALRFVDFLPVAYGVGGLLASIGPSSQRLGDLVAHTIVVRERKRAPDLGHFSMAPPPMPSAPLEDASPELTANERAIIVSFLERRASLTPLARAQVGEQLATGLYRRHGGVWAGAESYLERLAVGRHRE